MSRWASVPAELGAGCTVPRPMPTVVAVGATPEYDRHQSSGIHWVDGNVGGRDGVHRARESEPESVSGIDGPWVPSRSHMTNGNADDTQTRFFRPGIAAR